MTTDIMHVLSTYISTQILKQPARVILPHEPLLSTGLVDSFHLVDLSIFIEKTFNVLIDDTELNRDTFDSLAKLAAIIKSRM